jgi:hypothetical protein
MKRFLETLTAIAPFLDRYPTWVAVVVAVWILATAAMIIVLVLAPRSPQESGPSPSSLAVNATASPGANIYQAGRDVIVQNGSRPTTEPFVLRHHSSLSTTCPGTMFYLYDSLIGKRLAPIAYAAFVELVNKSDVPQGVHDYVVDGAIAGEWVRLANLNPLNLNQFYFAPNGLHDTRQWDFTQNSFDGQIRGRAIPGGESIRGWVFFECVKPQRNLIISPTKLQFSIETTGGTRQTLIVETGHTRTEGSSMLPGAAISVPAPHTQVDLSPIPILAHSDLLQGVRDGTIKKHTPRSAPKR